MCYTQSPRWVRARSDIVAILQDVAAARSKYSQAVQAIELDLSCWSGFNEIMRRCTGNHRHAFYIGRIGDRV